MHVVPTHRLASVMNENFDTRHDIYGDAALGEANLQMINIARKHGSAVKFPGSGGAVIGLCLDKEKQVCQGGGGGEGAVCCTSIYLTSCVTVPLSMCLSVYLLQLEMMREFQENGFVFCNVQPYVPATPWFGSYGKGRYDYKTLPFRISWCKAV